jgi:hypothetical protein
MTTCATDTSRKVADGTSMFPAPRSTEAKVFISQTPSEPQNATLE